MTQNRRSAVRIPAAFPTTGYTPFGYLNNPAHSAVMNRSGILRSVPPLGFGFWCRRFPWPYGEGAQRRVNYLSFLDLGLSIDGLSLHTREDFARAGVEIGSQYHTGTMMSYDFTAGGVTFSACYFLAGPDALACRIELANRGPADAQIVVHASHIYGFPEVRWWGSDGVASRYDPAYGNMLGTIYAYGDAFVLGADRLPAAWKATRERSEWDAWVQSNNLSCRDQATLEFPGAMYALLSYPLSLRPGAQTVMTLSLTRGVNQQTALGAHRKALRGALRTLNRKLEADRRFYESAPLLSGDFPKAWKEGWVYDLETIRMTIREPLGIYRHHWDGMQIYTPRAVLGEAMLDSLCLSYADMDLAKDVVLGTFADAPMANVPCSREDGSMNMIGAGGAECGTAPIWGMPFLAVRSLFERSGDLAWLAELYPYLGAFVDWWLEHRTDAEGWFHCNNSWESGQDGSKRFTFEGGSEADVADFVRTADVEAAMAHAMLTLAEFAALLGKEEDERRWKRLAEQRVATTRLMYRDGWFRDFDGRTGEPILLKDYFDVMMLMPLAVNIAAPDQVEGVRSKLAYFVEHPENWLEWPSFMQPFTEAAWNAGESLLAAGALAEIGHRIYGRSAARELKPVGKRDVGLPPEYNYRIPGVASEFWPARLDESIQNGAENYGWGATFPSLVIRNLFGFREEPGGFSLAPVIPDNLLAGESPLGRRFGITNLRYRGARLAVECVLTPGQNLETHVWVEPAGACTLTLRREDGSEQVYASAGQAFEFVLRGRNAERYSFALSSLKIE